MPNTIFSSDLKIIKKFIKKYKKVIIKPIHGYGGNNIKLVNIRTNEKKYKILESKYCNFKTC